MSTAGYSSSNRRPEDTLYDCFMLQLLKEMFSGPAQQQHHWQVDSGSPRAAAEIEDQQCWREWYESDMFKTLSGLVQAYDKPHVLVRGLVALVLQQQIRDQQPEQRAGAGRNGSASQGSNERRTVHQVMQFLEHVYLQRFPNQPAAKAATAVNRLLQGCAELLRPAANCAVEWRCAALNLMTTAVEDFVEEHSDDGVIQSFLWSNEAVEGLLYCLNHDSSIRIRRAAMKVLQLVVLPNGSGLTVQLVRTLAVKVCDKDSTVRQAALELLVQLDAGLICSNLTLAQWSGVVQAGLELCSREEGAGGQAAAAATPATAGRQGRKVSSQGVCKAGQQQLMQLFRAVLKPDGVAAAAAVANRDGAHTEHSNISQLHGMQGQDIRRWVMDNAHRIVGIAGCRVVLLLLLQNPELQGLCLAVAVCN